MRVPHPIQYQGSKRGLAPLILHYLPATMKRLVEPFAGSAAISIACATRNRCQSYWINDFNKPLAALVNLIINQPEAIADAYATIWNGQQKDTLEHYYSTREEFNRSHDPALFLYLLARCVKGAVRYNSQGLFNQSPDKRRLGTIPATMKENILGVSMLLRGKSVVTSHDYRDVLSNVCAENVVYMDPPYQGVCGERDSRYSTGIAFDEFVVALDQLNSRDIKYAVSYDGRTGARNYGQPLPKYLGLTLIELDAGRSSQATLLGRDFITVESLYLSTSLAAAVAAKATLHKCNTREQLALLESASLYGRLSKRVS